VTCRTPLNADGHPIDDQVQLLVMLQGLYPVKCGINVFRAKHGEI
jgi:hypothetical protein